MSFVTYQHIERFGNAEVEGIELGQCYCFSKVDGTNMSMWIDNGVVQVGSRKRHLTEDSNDNAGSREQVKVDPQFDGIKAFLDDHPNYRIFGEFLVPHTVATYRKDAWRKFYLFDFMDEAGNYIPYPDYKEWCDKYGIEYIPCMAVIKNGSYENFIHLLDQNNYLIEDGKGTGEGIVIKNYEFRNKYGRNTYAKIVTSEFKENFHKKMGANEVENKMIEDEIASKFCSLTLVDKTYAKIVTEADGWSSKFIPRLLESVYHDLIVEEMYEILKELKNPTIRFIWNLKLKLF